MQVLVAPKPVPVKVMASSEVPLRRLIELTVGVAQWSSVKEKRLGSALVRLAGVQPALG